MVGELRSTQTGGFLRREGNRWSFLRGEKSPEERGGNVRGGSIALQQAIKKKLGISPEES